MTSALVEKSAHRYPALAALLFAAEIATIGVVFKHIIDFDCRGNWSREACGFASGTMVSVYTVVAALALVWLLNPAPFRTLLSAAGERTWPLIVNAAGFAVALVPVAFLKNGAGQTLIVPAFVCWALGMMLLVGGLLLFLAPPARWRDFFSAEWPRLVPAALFGALAPALSTLIQPIWRLETLAGLTFDLVHRSLGLLGYAAQADATTKTIGSGTFFVAVDPVCSGIEGIMLITLFVTLYLVIFRRDLRFPHALVLYPLGIIASALFNVLRITVLLVIGIEGHPELAVGGFHSHAGWLMFTLVSIGIILAAQAVPGLQKHASADPAAGSSGPGAPALPLFRDPVASCILPFAVFMFSALLAQAFTNAPGAIYPLRVLAMAGILAAFAPLYARLTWRADPVAVVAGGVVAAVWIGVPVDATDATPPYGDLSGAMLIGWFVFRGLGTVALVPIIEELFFRGYLEPLLRIRDTLAWRVGAALLVAVAFALLHDRWAEAFAASLVFSWVSYRRKRVTDAIICHAVANALVYAAALATGNLAMI